MFLEGAWEPRGEGKPHQAIARESSQSAARARNAFAWPRDNRCHPPSVRRYISGRERNSLVQSRKSAAMFLMASQKWDRLVRELLHAFIMPAKKL